MLLNAIYIICPQLKSYNLKHLFTTFLEEGAVKSILIKVILNVISDTNKSSSLKQNPMPTMVSGRPIQAKLPGDKNEQIIKHRNSIIPD